MTNQQIIICKNILCENVQEKLIIRFVVALQIGSGFYYRPPRKLREGNSHVCLSKGYPMWPFPIVHWTSPDRNPQPRSAHGTSLHMHPTASDIWWPRLETCSKFFTWWLLKQIWLASGWYASYWNTFLCIILKCAASVMCILRSNRDSVTWGNEVDCIKKLLHNKWKWT